MRSDCEKCKMEFQIQDKQYQTNNQTVCFLCCSELLKEWLKTLGTNIWTRPFGELYRLAFPYEASSWYVHPLQKALTELYLENWAARPTRAPRLFW